MLKKLVRKDCSSSKAGIIAFICALKMEAADEGITVNCVCPNYVVIVMVNAIPEHVKNAIISQISIGGRTAPTELANTVCFLTSEDSGYIARTELAINRAL